MVGKTLTRLPAMLFEHVNKESEFIQVSVFYVFC